MLAIEGSGNNSSALIGLSSFSAVLNAVNYKIVVNTKYWQKELVFLHDEFFRPFPLPPDIKESAELYKASLGSDETRELVRFGISI